MSVAYPQVMEKAKENKQHDCFTVEVVDKVGLVTMCRPERSNSMIPAFWSELPAIEHVHSMTAQAVT